jgi:anti-sigma regulatory factor (Ser/Thr protein kinase)
VNTPRSAQRGALICSPRHTGGVRRAETTLPRVAQSASAARLFVSATIDEWEYGDPEQVIALLTSEIITNAVRHSSGTIGLGITMADRHTVRVYATDESPHSPVQPNSEPDDAGGRGLHIVEVLARRWGTDRYEDVKVVWFEAPVVRRPGT